jgi:hypothetical protein
MMVSWAISKYKMRHISKTSRWKEMPRMVMKVLKASQHSAYCCISLPPPVENINHSKALVGREGNRD